MKGIVQNSGVMHVDRCRQIIESAQQRQIPIEAHQDFKNYVKRDECQQMVHSFIKNERQKLLDKYACFNGNEYYRGSCERPKTIEDFDITNHPDIKKYIMKDEAGKVLTAKIKKIEQLADSRPIENHPDYERLKSDFDNQLKEKTSQSNLGNTIHSQCHNQNQTCQSSPQQVINGKCQSHRQADQSHLQADQSHRQVDQSQRQVDQSQRQVDQSQQNYLRLKEDISNQQKEVSQQKVEFEKLIKKQQNLEEHITLIPKQCLSPSFYQSSSRTPEYY